MLESSAHASSSPDPGRLLSPRETEVLDLASLGLTNAQIALRLSVTIHAVKFHLAAIYRKLEVSNRTTAVGLYLRSLQEQVTETP
jgi:DNA-binding NarL/FixJ family response regulator